MCVVCFQNTFKTKYALIVEKDLIKLNIKKRYDNFLVLWNKVLHQLGYVLNNNWKKCY